MSSIIPGRDFERAQKKKNGDPHTRAGRRKQATNQWPPLRRRLLRPSSPTAPIPSRPRVVGSGTAEAAGAISAVATALGAISAAISAPCGVKGIVDQRVV